MSNAQNPAADIPSGLEDTDRKFGKPVQDWAVLIGIPVISTFFLYTIIEPPKLIAGGMFTVAALASIAMIILQPSHLGALEWIQSIKHYYKRQSKSEHISETSGMEREQGHFTSTRRAWETAARTQDDTHVKQVHPDLNAIERTDGALFGAVEITGSNMALAGNREWQQKTASLGELYNQSIDFPVQTYVTTKPFPMDEHVDKFKQRLNDKDLKDNPIMDELAKSYMDSVLQDTKLRGTNQRKYYMMTKVEKADIYDDGAGEATAIQTLRDVRFVGTVLTYVLGKKSDLTEAQKRERMGKELQKRLNKIGPIEGCKIRPVKVANLTVLHREHWTNRESRYDYEAERFLRTASVVTADEGMSDVEGMEHVESPNFDAEPEDDTDESERETSE